MVTSDSKAFYAIIKNMASGTDFMAKYCARIKFIPSDEPYLSYKLNGKDSLDEILCFVSDIFKFYHCKK